MPEPEPPTEDLAAWKAQQETNRAARLRQLRSPEETWRWQQEALSALAKLRPDGARPLPPAREPRADNLKA